MCPLYYCFIRSVFVEGSIVPNSTKKYEHLYREESCSSPDVKDVTSADGRSVDVVARLVEEDLEVADDGVGSLPATPDSARLRDLDPPLAGSAHTMMDVDTEWQFG